MLRTPRTKILALLLVLLLGSLAAGCGASRSVSDSVISTNKTACAQFPTIIAHRKTSVVADFSAVATVVVRSTPVLNGDEPAVQTATANRIAQGIAGRLTQVARGATVVASIDATSFAEC